MLILGRKTTPSKRNCWNMQMNKTVNASFRYNMIDTELIQFIKSSPYQSVLSYPLLHSVSIKTKVTTTYQKIK